MVDIYDYVEANFKVIGIHEVIGGMCGCGDPECKAVYKHPLMKNWQNTPLWDDEQFELMEKMGHFKVGFGVLCEGYLIVDIDKRNNGFESLEKLNKTLGYDLNEKCDFIVSTGGGGLHLYFKLSEPMHLRKNLKRFEGIDFLSNGFVVGCSSLHKSGILYEDIKGNPSSIGLPPAELIDLLTYDESDYSDIEFSNDYDVKELLSYIPNHDSACLGYDDWVVVGMVIRHTYGADGYEIWKEWSEQSSLHDESNMRFKYKSFDDYHGNKATVKKLIGMAKKNGYVDKHEKDAVAIINNILEHQNLDDFPEVDLDKACGLVGRCAEYIDRCCLYPRKKLAMSSALAVVGTLAGLDTIDLTYDVKTNCIFFNVAGSGTGKESILQAHRELLLAGGTIGCMYGSIKSEQEIYKNITTHQLSSYLIDELGIFLSKVSNSKRSCASYLEGVISAIMQIYSKSNGRLIIGGDALKTLQKEIKGEISKLDKESHSYSSHVKSLSIILDELPKGLKNPFLTLSGFTTPFNFIGMFDRENTCNGFIGRSILFEEKDDNPRKKDNFVKIKSIPLELENALKGLSCTGTIDFNEYYRVQESEIKKVVKTNDDAKALLERVYNYFHDWCIREYYESQLHPIVRRAYELVLKVSMILAVGDGYVRTKDHVIWAFQLIKKDIQTKLYLTKGNVAEDEDNIQECIVHKVLQSLDADVPNSLKSIYKKYPKYKIDDFESVLNHLIDSGVVRCDEIKTSIGKPIKVYYLTKFKRDENEQY